MFLRADSPSTNITIFAEILTMNVSFGCINVNSSSFIPSEILAMLADKFKNTDNTQITEAKFLTFN